MAGNFFVDGILHITDIEGYDHMLFLLAMCSPYTHKEWKPILFLATAFTLGHSASLLFCALDLILFSSSAIEFCIPLTILITAAVNFVSFGKPATIAHYRYLTALLFGVIHGMGFSSYFRMITGEGDSFIKQLFLFNIGVEAGQLFIIACILALVEILAAALPKTRKKTPKGIALISFVLALTLAIEKWPF